MAFFVLMWGSIDLVSSSIGLVNVNMSAANISSQTENVDIIPDGKSDQFFDVYYQKKMLADRFWDSLVRFVISGAIFLYCRKQINKLEAAA